MKTLSFILLMFYSFATVAQEQREDLIYLKNDMVLRGRILERNADGSIKMKQTDGREIVVSSNEIKSIILQGIGTIPADYGGKTALGVSLFGDGGFGAHFRFRGAEELYCDLAVQSDGILLVNDVTDEGLISIGIGAAGEVNYFLKRKYKESNQKIRANGLFFRASYGFGNFNTTRVAAGWSSEYFRLNRFKRGFLLNLGLGLVSNHWYDEPSNAVYIENRQKVEGSVYLRLQWNFFQ